MSELAVIDSNNYAAMAQMTGMAYDAEGGKNKSTLARIKLQKKPIKGKAEVNGKNVTVDVVTAGSFMIEKDGKNVYAENIKICLLYTSPSPRDGLLSRMPSSA